MKVLYLFAIGMFIGCFTNTKPKTTATLTTNNAASKPVTAANKIVLSEKALNTTGCTFWANITNL